MKPHRLLWLMIAVTALSLLVASCAPVGVHVWERDILAKEEMQPSYAVIDRSVDDHIYFSKEASSGGRSFSGGGCGCN